MSAFVVILALRMSGEWRSHDLDSAHGVDTLGQALFDLNQAAVNGRYRLTDEAPRFKFQYFRHVIDKVEALKALQCLCYQCHEDATVDSPLLAELNTCKNALAFEIIRKLPGYDAAPWGHSEQAERAA